MVARLSDGKAPDGFDLVRIKDIQKVRSDKDRESIAVRVLKARDQWPIEAPGCHSMTCHSPWPQPDKATHCFRFMSRSIAPTQPWVGAVRGVNDDDVELG